MKLTKFTACYFNSLIQFYYAIPSFVKEILECNVAEEEKIEP